MNKLKILISRQQIAAKVAEMGARITADFAGEPVIRHFVLGANSWAESETWGGAQTRTYFLRSAGSANSRKGNGKLTGTSPDSIEPRDWFVQDPETPVIAPGGPTAAAGSFDQAGIEQGNNVLVYTSDPLEEDCSVFGSPILTIYATSSADTTDFVGKLVRVRPDQKRAMVHALQSRGHTVAMTGDPLSGSRHCQGHQRQANDAECADPGYVGLERDDRRRHRRRSESRDPTSSVMTEAASP